MIGERVGAWLVFHWALWSKVGRGPAEFPSEIASLPLSRTPTNEIVELRIERKRTTSLLGAEVY